MKEVYDLTDVIDMLENIDTLADGVEIKNEIKKVIEELFLLMMKFNK